MLSTVRLGLYLGKGKPSKANATVMKAVQQVSVQLSETAGDQGFSITFNAERGHLAWQDYSLLQEPSLTPGNRAVITLTLNATPHVLMDGIITQVQVTPQQGTQAGTITVTGQDLSTLLNLVDLNVTLPIPSVTGVVGLILAKYTPLGLVPKIIPPIKEALYGPTEKLHFQEGTDLEYLQSLATKNGYIFAIRPGPTPGVSQAYWGPLVKLGAVQRALSVDMGHNTNVESLNFEYDTLKPRQVYGLVAKPNVPVPVPILGLTNINPPPVAKQSPFISNQPLIKKERLGYKGTDLVEAYLQAQATVDKSAGTVVAVSGTLDGLRYGDILRAPGLVGLRGAGQTYDGLYYVKSVSHTISPGQYQQQFSLGREGLGSTTERVTV